MDQDARFDENSFVVEDQLWFVGPKDRPDDLGKVQEGLAKAHTESGMHPVVFTTSDLAFRFIKKMGGMGRLSPFTCQTVDEFGVFLEFLSDHGEANLAFDPGAHHARIIPIANVLDAIRNRLP